MFLIRYYHGPTSTWKVERLTPNPTDCEYPPKRQVNVRTSRDGAVVVQRPAHDRRPRRWLWRNYPKAHTAFNSLWTFLESLEMRARLDAGYTDEWVQVWENETGAGGFDRTTDNGPADTVTYTNLKWCKVKFVQVTRDVEGGGPVRYPEAYVEFWIDDTTW
jgi:hypothetical protein